MGSKAKPSGSWRFRQPLVPWTRHTRVSGAAGCGEPKTISVSRSSARNPNRRGWSPLLPQLHGVPPWGDKKKGGGPKGSSSFFFAQPGSDEALRSPSIDGGEENRKDCCTRHSTRAQGRGIMEREYPNPQHPAHHRRESTQNHDESGVSGGRRGFLDGGPHEDSDEAAHDDPDADADPVFH